MKKLDMAIGALSSNADMVAGTGGEGVRTNRIILPVLWDSVEDYVNGLVEQVKRLNANLAESQAESARLVATLAAIREPAARAKRELDRTREFEDLAVAHNKAMDVVRAGERHRSRADGESIDPFLYFTYDRKEHRALAVGSACTKGLPEEFSIERRDGDDLAGVPRWVAVPALGRSGAIETAILRSCPDERRLGVPD